MAAVRMLVLASLAIGCSYTPPPASTIGDDDDDAGTPDTSMPDSTNPCDDDDGDTVCNELDACPGNDDLADADNDNVADGCDTWPCGAEPATPSATVTVGDATWGATLSNVNFGGGLLTVANANTDVSLSFDFNIHDSSCPGNCVDQIEVGLVAGRRQRCPFDQAVPKGQNVPGDRTTMLRTPNVPGVYSVRFGLGQNFNCNSGGANNWWLGEPAADQTIAMLCVP